MQFLSKSLTVQGYTVKSSMGSSYSSHQYGFLNFSVSSLNLPSIFLGIILVIGIWLLFKFKSSCRVFNNHNNDQSTALISIAKSLESAQVRPMMQHPSTLVALVPTVASRKFDSMFLDL